MKIKQLFSDDKKIYTARTILESLPDWPTEEFVDEVFSNALNPLEDSKYGYYLVAELSDTGEHVGSASVFSDESGKICDIGYSVHKSKWRQGFGSEIITLLLEFIKALGTEKVMAEVAVDNIPSNMLLRKFGFEVEKETEFKKYNMDVRFDSYIYAKSL